MTKPLLSDLLMCEQGFRYRADTFYLRLLYNSKSTNFSAAMYARRVIAFLLVCVLALALTASGVTEGTAICTSLALHLFPLASLLEVQISSCCSPLNICLGQLCTGIVSGPEEGCNADTEEACVIAPDCVWCKSAAVGNSCFDKVTANQCALQFLAFGVPGFWCSSGLRMF